MREQKQGLSTQMQVTMLPSSSITNCYFKTREGDPTVLFDFSDDGRAVVTLHKYLIVPLETSPYDVVMALREMREREAAIPPPQEAERKS